MITKEDSLALLKEIIDAAKSEEGISPEMEAAFTKRVSEIEKLAILKKMDSLTGTHGITFSDFSDTIKPYQTNLSTIRDLMLGAYFMGVEFSQIAVNLVPAETKSEEIFQTLNYSFNQHKNNVLDLAMVNRQNAEMGSMANTGLS